MRLFLFFIFAASYFLGTAQDKKDSIVAEGKLLYRLEMASWYGTDVLTGQFSDKTASTGGYFSYADKERTKCIFFTKGDQPRVLLAVSFDESYKTETALIEKEERDFSPQEKDIYVFRKKALEEINNDTLFKNYKNTNLNLIPLGEKDVKKVYVITGTSQNGIVIFGNDYLILFDKDYNLVSKRKFHQNIIPINYKEQEKGAMGAMHMHLPETGDYITATDICTLMLYSRFAGWETHMVVSENLMNIWNCKSNSLIVTTRKGGDETENKKSGKKKN